jgi:hypothetical protein
MEEEKKPGSKTGEMTVEFELDTGRESASQA